MTVWQKSLNTKDNVHVSLGFKNHIYIFFIQMVDFMTIVQQSKKGNNSYVYKYEQEEEKCVESVTFTI